MPEPSTPPLENTRAKLQAYLRESGTSQNSVANGIGVTGSVISSYLKGKYKGDVTSVEKRLERYLGLQDERKNIGLTGAAPVVVETKAYRQIVGVLHSTQKHSRFGVIYGDSGVGKTTAIRAYAAANDGLVVLVEADYGYTAKVLFMELCDRLNLDQRGDLHSLLTRIIERLAGSQRLIIIDEAEHLKYNTLELVRRLRDHAKIGVVLAGMPRLRRNICGDANHYAQLYKRANAWGDIGGLTNEDVALLVAAHFGRTRLQDDFLPAVQTACRHNARILDNILGWCDDLAEIGAAYDAEMVANARAYCCPV